MLPESTRNRADYIKERISELEDRNIEMIQMEKEREIILKKIRKSYRAVHFAGRATLG